MRKPTAWESLQEFLEHSQHFYRHDSATWHPFDAALAMFQSSEQLDGIGFALGEPFVGVDLDDCRDAATGELLPYAQYILGRLNSYAEVSPSGKGVKLLCQGRMPDGQKADHEKGVEIFQSGRYFTITGKLTTDDGCPRGW